VLLPALPLHSVRLWEVNPASVIMYGTSMYGIILIGRATMLELTLIPICCMSQPIYGALITIRRTATPIPVVTPWVITIHGVPSEKVSPQATTPWMQMAVMV